MKTFKIQANEAEIAEFIKWAWNWWEYDAVTPEDKEFEVMAKITWQLNAQMKTKTGKA